MFWSALVAFYRTSARHPLYTALNVLGLAFGIAAFMVISLYIRFELTYDRWLPGSSKIYELTTTFLRNGVSKPPWQSGSGEALDILRGNDPTLVGTRIVHGYPAYSAGQQSFSEEEFLVDPTFFDVLPIPVVAGDVRLALQPGYVAVSESIARKYFGATDVVGRRLTLWDQRWGTRTPVVGPPAEQVIVAAVLRDAPPNSRWSFSIIRRLTAERMSAYEYWRDWGVTQHRTLFRVASRQQAELLNAQLDQIVDTTGVAGYHDVTAPQFPRHTVIQVRLTPFSEWRQSDGNVRTRLLVFGVTGPLALVIAFVNHINLSTALAGLRAREVALRKVAGATRGQLRLQFLAESVCLSMTALLLSFSLVELVLPVINRVGGLSLEVDGTKDLRLVAALSLICLAGGVLAGMYPAWLSASPEPARLLSSVASVNGNRVKRWLRQGLVGFQFLGVTIFLILLTAFYVQVIHMERSDLGFSRHGLLATSSMSETGITLDEAQRVLAGWRTLPNVETVASGPMPGGYDGGAAVLTKPGNADETVTAQMEAVEPGFFSTLGVGFLSGRDVAPGEGTDFDHLYSQRSTSQTVPLVVNEKLVKALGVPNKDAILGYEFAWLDKNFRIVGVVDDFRLNSPTDEIPPTLYAPVTDVLLRKPTVLRYRGVGDDIMRARMESVWRAMAPSRPVTIKAATEYLDEFYVSDRRATHLLLSGAILVAAVGIVGLYGLAAFNTSSRLREIGLRKAMGATRWSVISLLLFQFLKPVLLANLIAWPVAYIVLDRWLKQFDDRVPLEPWFFLAGSGVSLSVAVLTVAGLAFAAAGTSPGQALRRE